MYSRNYYIVNGITFYRLIAAPALLFLVIENRLDIFKWFLALSFFTDAIDGYLARRFNVFSLFGSKLDSVADDLTIIVSVIAMFVFKPEMVKQEIMLISFLLILFVVQTILALIRYGKISSFHTYFAKCAAVLQAAFLILLFFLPQPSFILFYFTVIITAIELVEEIILVLILPEWEVNVKGLYWVLRKRPPKEV